MSNNKQMIDIEFYAVVYVLNVTAKGRKPERGLVFHIAGIP